MYVEVLISTGCFYGKYFYAVFLAAYFRGLNRIWLMFMIFLHNIKLIGAYFG